MRSLRILAVTAVAVAVLACPSLAFDLGARAPDKPAGAAAPPPPPDPDVIRQGGDTLDDAVLLDPILVAGVTGTTAGYTDDYDEVCPFADSVAPDVVYRLAPPADVVVDIDMYGSAYDTKIYVYREDMTLVACNDDFYPDFVSKLEDVVLSGSVKYFLVIDGYGEEAGDYVLTIAEAGPCAVECPPGAVLEGEPPLVDDYVDLHNGGCNTDPDDPPFGHIDGYHFCGVSGWYVHQGANYRDTDWYRFTMPSWGFVEITGDAEYATHMFELGPQDCGVVSVIQSVVIGPCQEASMVITDTPGNTVWFWVGPTTFDGPVNEYDYVLNSWDWEPNAVATETRSWSAVKGLFD